MESSSPRSKELTNVNWQPHRPRRQEDRTRRNLEAAYRTCLCAWRVTLSDEYGNPL